MIVAQRVNEVYANDSSLGITELGIERRPHTDGWLDYNPGGESAHRTFQLLAPSSSQHQLTHFFYGPFQDGLDIIIVSPQKREGFQNIIKKYMYLHTSIYFSVKMFLLKCFFSENRGES